MIARLLSKADAAAYLGVSVRSLDEKRARGEIPTRYDGDRPLFDRRDLDAWADALPTERRSA